MTRRFSLHLDALRVLAALAVLLSHLAYPQASASLGWVRELNIGSDAVVVFFVLSGLVIAHTAREKDRTLGRFAFARVTRLWSVALPAILLTGLLCIAGKALAPDFYAGLTLGEFLDPAVRAVFFANALWFSDAQLPTNSPYWSVAYEFWCYVGFAAAVFLKGRTRLYALAAVALVAGPRVLLLAPCWIVGVFVQRAVAQPQLGIPRGAAIALLALPLAAYALLQAAQAPAALTALTGAALGGLDPNVVLGFSDEFLWNWLLALLTGAHLLGAAALARQASAPPAAVERPIRWAAGRTFSLYLFHMPLLQLAVALPSYDPAEPLHTLLLAAGLLIAGVALAEITERRLPEQRALAARLLALGVAAARRITPPAPPRPLHASPRPPAPSP